MHERAAAPPDATEREARQARDLAAVGRALGGMAPGSLVLQAPCDRPAVTALLLQRGLRVLGACADDAAARAAEAHAARVLARPLDQIADVARFAVFDLAAAPLDDGTIDATACLGLLDAVADVEARRAVMRELARVTRGPLLLSYPTPGLLTLLRAGWRSLGRSAGTPAGVVESGAASWRAVRSDIAATRLRAEAVFPGAILRDSTTVVRAVRLGSADAATSPVS